MQLCSEMGSHVIKGFYNRDRQNFIADYFIHYGDNLLKVEPAKLKLLITDRLNNLLQNMSGSSQNNRPGKRLSY